VLVLDAVSESAADDLLQATLNELTGSSD
jgi:hypothetical protein